MGAAPRHYLDHNATSPLRPEARAAMLLAMDAAGNGSSVHREGRAARAMIDAARQAVADLAGVPPTTVHFTSGGTEANNWALALGTGCGRRLLVTGLEHASVLEPARTAGAGIVAVAPAGIVDLAALDRALATGGPALVACMAANNETGAIQPVAEVARLCRAHGAWLLVDAVQAAAKLALAPLAADADFLSLSAHKLGGPAGVGALVLRAGFDPAPLIRGGGQEFRRRAGTENLVGIAGFGAAATTADPQALSARLAPLRDRLEARLRQACPTLAVHGAAVPRLASTACIGMPGVPAATQVMALDLAGVAASAGSACSSGKVTPSHVLQAMGLGQARAGEAVRFSLGWTSSVEDVDAAVAAWTQLWKRRNAA